MDKQIELEEGNERFTGGGVVAALFCACCFIAGVAVGATVVAVVVS